MPRSLALAAFAFALRALDRDGKILLGASTFLGIASLVAALGELQEQPLRQPVEAAREEQDAHQQMRGSWSPASQSTMRRPPNAACTTWRVRSASVPMWIFSLS